jgi:hypothetical protein
MNELTWGMGAVVAALVGCGGGGGGGGGAGVQPTALKGVLVDAPVAGVGYSCGAFSGTTAADGAFDYEAGSQCSFRIGGITLGSVPAGALITPVDLVDGAIDETNPKVVNITRLLISLDSDNDASNGIAVASSVGTALASASLDFGLDEAAFAAQAAPLLNTAIAGRALASADTARSHLGATLLGLLAGNYSCTYAIGAQQAGTASLAIASGVITGTGTPAGGGSFTLDGQVGTSGDATLVGGSTSNGATFDGSFKSDGSGSGTWNADSDSGSWACHKS